MQHPLRSEFVETSPGGMLYMNMEATLGFERRFSTLLPLRRPIHTVSHLALKVN